MIPSNIQVADTAKFTDLVNIWRIRLFSSLRRDIDISALSYMVPTTARKVYVEDVKLTDSEKSAIHVALNNAAIDFLDWFTANGYAVVYEKTCGYQVKGIKVLRVMTEMYNCLGQPSSDVSSLMIEFQITFNVCGDK